MGLLNQLLGNAEACSVEKAAEAVAGILSPGENIEQAYQLYRDVLVFTGKRLIIVDYQGVTGKKTEYRSLPYTGIVSFAVETAGQMDLESELKLFILGGGKNSFVNGQPNESLYGENEAFSLAKNIGLSLLGDAGQLVQAEQDHEHYREGGRYEILTFPKDSKDIQQTQQALARYIVFADCD